jgi:hypothetical protein
VSLRVRLYVRVWCVPPTECWGVVDCLSFTGTVNERFLLGASGDLVHAVAAAPGVAMDEVVKAADGGVRTITARWAASFLAEKCILAPVPMLQLLPIAKK